MVPFVKKVSIFFTSYICTLFYYDFISSNLDTLFVKTRRKYTRFMTRTFNFLNRSVISYIYVVKVEIFCMLKKYR